MPYPRVPDASVKMTKSGDLDQYRSGIIARPFQVGKESLPLGNITASLKFHRNLVVGSLAVVLRSIRRRRNMRPTGMMRQAQFSLPVRDSNLHLRH